MGMWLAAVIRDKKREKKKRKVKIHFPVPSPALLSSFISYFKNPSFVGTPRMSARNGQHKAKAVFRWRENGTVINLAMTYPIRKERKCFY